MPEFPARDPADGSPEAADSAASGPGESGPAWLPAPSGGLHGIARVQGVGAANGHALAAAASGEVDQTSAR